MNYYIIAGEASGDLHGSNLIKALLKQDTAANIRCWGGDLMEQAGGHLAKHYKTMSFMGFAEVLKNIPAIFKNIRFCKEDITAFKPDVIIFIDFSGFNLRIAKWAKQHRYTTNYYISPQVWASRAGRVKKIKRDIDQMYVILPFEKAFYAKYGMEVDFVGHPLLDAIANTPITEDQHFRKTNQLDLERPIIALLPGSRKQEVEKMLTIMLSVIGNFRKYQFVIAGAPSLPMEFYAPFTNAQTVGFVSNDTYSLLSHSHAALVTSGTATLETALFKVPQVVCYKGSWLSYQIAKRIITLKYISLVNLIMDTEVVKELIQEELHTNNLINELQKTLRGPGRENIIKGYTSLIQKLGGAGASDKVASLIIKNA
ncbi:Lipid-A-disaccharide synthase [Croceitalea dokdonensis DOKDO 023]|uniref:Lipid-A-disaccharide synthase n=1 Tax=Croceitalea dokdonensis DOKDO 023 TaxID=1300341 RepID=A0A0P7AGR6_9FLAO|nr:lipid-A-disaccharide synthase [Croceitalea dokdonensis]KPM32654.1 Lipid-A-disaccharide synthase [Croceitalea dokdonensis DOKDO 023]